MAGVFVTGTGTDVGKTFVTAALVRHLRSTGKTVDAYQAGGQRLRSSERRRQRPRRPACGARPRRNGG